MKTNPPFVDAALQDADHGLAVLPLHTPINERCTCGRSDCTRVGKHPRTEHGAQDASTDAAQIQEWGELWPNANLGIAAKQSGLVLVDVDPRNGGDFALGDLCMLKGGLPRTVEDRTGGGGTHYYFTRPDARIVNKKIIAPGVEAIANGYVVAPWSIHPSGNFYTWRNRQGRVKFAEAPDWMIEMMLDPVTPAAPIPLIVPTSGIPREVWHILAGTTKKLYGNYKDRQDRSAAEYTAILCLVNKGWDFDRIYNLFADRAHEGTHYAELAQAEGERAARVWLQRLYQKAVAWSAAQESPACQAAREYLEWAQTTPFPGQSGAYTQAVALAHGAIALRAAKTEYQASERELAERAGCSRKAVRNANRRLAKIGAIKRTDHSTAELATRWALPPVCPGPTPLRVVGG